MDAIRLWLGRWFDIKTLVGQRRKDLAAMKTSSQAGNFVMAQNSWSFHLGLPSSNLTCAQFPSIQC